MDYSQLKQQVEHIFPQAVFAANTQYVEVVIPIQNLHDFCSQLKSDTALQFDYLISLTAVDWNDHFMIVCHLTSTTFRHTIVVKAKIDDRINPAADTISDLWITAEFHEREVFDLFGIFFRNHPDLRRLFLEDDFGYPLRKEFTDESAMIVK